MSDYTTEPFEPTRHQRDENYGYEKWEREPGGTPNILWGRIAVFGASLVIAWLFGRACAPAGVPQQQLDAVRADLQDARAEIADLQTELARATGPKEKATPSPTPTGTTTPGATVRTHIVESGDTLTSIAELYYGDASLDNFLADYNDIEDPTAISPGQEIRIPPAPEEEEE